jgi:hypothetical protein
LGLVQGPAKDIAAENHGRDENAGTAEFDLLHLMILFERKIAGFARRRKGGRPGAALYLAKSLSDVAKRLQSKA